MAVHLSELRSWPYRQRIKIIHTCLFDIIEGGYRFISRAQAPTTTQAPWSNISHGVQQAIAKLNKITQRNFLDSQGSLIIPGGESSTMLKTRTEGLWDAIQAFGQHKSIWGICAGSILLSVKTLNPEQESLGLLDMDISRNDYGAQNESFIKELTIDLDEPHEQECYFIRAPRIVRVGQDLNIRAFDNDDPIMVENQRHMATTFHPELADSQRIHDYFLMKVSKNRG